MKRIKKIVMAVFLAVLMIFSNSNKAEALSAEYVFSGSDSNSKYGTNGKLQVNTTYYVDAPFIGNCEVKSKGSSDTSFSKNGVKCTRTFKAHTIEAKISGIGFSSVSSDSGLEVASESRCATYSADTYDWDYTIYSDIWRMFHYQEIHSVSYKLKVPNKEATTITMSKKIKY